MKLPRNVSGEQLAKALKLLGYEITRQNWQPFSTDNHSTR
jgi:hypothetical protein